MEHLRYQIKTNLNALIHQERYLFVIYINRHTGCFFFFFSCCFKLIYILHYCQHDKQKDMKGLAVTLGSVIVVCNCVMIHYPSNFWDMESRMISPINGIIITWNFLTWNCKGFPFQRCNWIEKDEAHWLSFHCRFVNQQAM